MKRCKQQSVKELKRKKCRDKSGWNNEIVIETGEEALCRLLNMPTSTPYLGMLNELGIWKVEERLNYV